MGGRAVLRDGYGRVVDYLRVSVTDRCNSRCFYCMPRSGVPFIPPDRILRYEEIVALAGIFTDLGVKKVRVTGGEPLIRENIHFLIERLAALEGVEELVLTTNGLKLAEHAESLAREGVKRVNVSLDTLRESTFRHITGRDGPAQVLGGIEAALDAGLEVKLNAVAMRGVNDCEFGDFVAYAIDRGIRLRFIELMPSRYNEAFAAGLFIPAREIVERISERYLLEPLARGNGDAVSDSFRASPRGAGGSSSRDDRAAGKSASIGLISPMSEPFCGQCNRVRLLADGTLRTCLFGEGGPNLKEMIRDGVSRRRVEETIVGAVARKPRGIRNTGRSAAATAPGEAVEAMHRIGG